MDVNIQIHMIEHPVTVNDLGSVLTNAVFYSNNSDTISYIPINPQMCRLRCF